MKHKSTLKTSVDRVQINRARRQLQELAQKTKATFLHFPLKNIARQCTQQGTSNKLNCYVFLRAGLGQYFGQIITKFPSNEGILRLCLEIVTTSLMLIDEEEIFWQFGTTEFVNICLQKIN